MHIYTVFNTLFVSLFVVFSGYGAEPVQQGSFEVKLKEIFHGDTNTAITAKHILSEVNKKTELDYVFYLNVEPSIILTNVECITLIQ